MMNPLRARLNPLVLLGPALLASAAPAAFCLWDRDTLKSEAAGAPRVAEAIVGHFDRYPDRYYEMRLVRVAWELNESPDDLALYDDAAVAVERLGRSDEAIEWMARKRVVLDELGERSDPHHEYTYLANLGTFHVHRWIHSGAKRDSLADLERGRDLLTRALELNPEAHFGRERWQLMAVEFLIDPPPLGGVLPRTLLPLQHEAWPGSRALEKLGYGDAVEGLSGLVTLGSAWESVDIFQALVLALIDQGDAHLAWLASLRLEELYAEGRESLVSDPPELKQETYGPPESLFDEDIARIRAFYPNARAAAEARRESRNAYLLERLGIGQHPDTDPSFWEDWSGDPNSEVEIPADSLRRRLDQYPLWPLSVAAALLASLLLLAGLVTVRLVRRRRARLAGES